MDLRAVYYGVLFGGLAALILYGAIYLRRKKKLKKPLLHQIIFAAAFVLYAGGIVGMQMAHLDQPQGAVQAYPLSAGLFTGTLSNGLPDGDGTLQMNDGQRVMQCSFADGLAAGKGTVSSPDGSYFYEGELANNQMNGTGRLTIVENAKTTVYEGAFQNGIFTGKGTITYPEGRVYDGLVENYQPCGLGKTTLADGSVYTGNHKNGVFYGEGELVCAACGHTYRGGWQNNMMCGPGVLVQPDGTTLEGRWREDRLKGSIFGCSAAFYSENLAIAQQEKGSGSSFKESANKAG